MYRKTSKKNSRRNVTLAGLIEIASIEAQETFKKNQEWHDLKFQTEQKIKSIETQIRMLQHSTSAVSDTDELEQAKANLEKIRSLKSELIGLKEEYEVVCASAKAMDRNSQYTEQKRRNLIEESKATNDRLRELDGLIASTKYKLEHYKAQVQNEIISMENVISGYEKQKEMLQNRLAELNG